MRVDTILNVSAEYLFKRLVAPMQYDILQQTNQKLSVAQLQAFRYSAKLVNQTSATIEFITVQANRKLAYRFITATQTTAVCYTLQPLAANQVKLTYCEQITSSKRRFSKKLFSWMSDEIKSHNLKKQFKHFEVGY